MHNSTAKHTLTEVEAMPSKKMFDRFKKHFMRDYQLYLMLLPTLVFFIIFEYLPMYGIQLAFKKYSAMKGIWGSPWNGLDNFRRFFNSYAFWRVIKNTLGISIYQLFISFPLPIILALLLNQVRSKRFKKVVQTVTYAPHFISTVVLVGMLHIFLSPRSGIINHAIKAMSGNTIFFLGEASWFKTIFVFSGVWQNCGWGAIVYLAALTAVDTDLYSSAYVDGCNRFQIIRHVDIPSILPTAVIMFILNAGKMMRVGFQKVYLLQNDLNLSTSEVISTYVYKIGLIDGQFSYSTAVNLFNTIINIILLVTANKLAKKVTDTSLW